MTADARQLVAGIDSSTQSCKVVVRDAETGALVRRGSAPHPPGTEVDPAHWWRALEQAAAAAGGLADVAALAVAGQQHGLVCLDESGAVVRDALLWNDTRSAQAAADLIAEWDDGGLGATRWAEAVGVVPVAAVTVAKLRWVAEHEPAGRDRTAAVCLPHDWLTARLLGSTVADALVTDRGEASGTGYWSAATGEYRLDLLERAFGARPAVPRVLRPAEAAGPALGLDSAAIVGPGTGDNAAAALGLDAGPGDVLVSIGTSGVVSARADAASADPSGVVSGFASATGDFLPLVCTLNAARVLDAAAALLQVDHAELSRLALSAPPGADGLVLVPYLEGERTPNRPHATGSVHGLTLRNSSPAHLARASVEGLLCGLADGLDALRAHGIVARRVILIGGGARSEAVGRIAPTIFGCPVLVAPVSEYVADGAARQAAWTLRPDAGAPAWAGDAADGRSYHADPHPHIRSRYAQWAASSR